jgi:hypothetical protein
MDRFEVKLNRELLPASKGERAMGLGGYFALWVLFSQHGRYEDEPVYLPLHESVDVIQLGFSVKPGRAQADIAVLLQYDFLYAIGYCHIRLMQSIRHDDSYDVSPFILNVPGKPDRRVIRFLHGVQDFFLVSSLTFSTVYLILQQMKRVAQDNPLYRYGSVII